MVFQFTLARRMHHSVKSCNLDITSVSISPSLFYSLTSHKLSNCKIWSQALVCWLNSNDVLQLPCCYPVRCTWTVGSGFLRNSKDETVKFLWFWLTQSSRYKCKSRARFTTLNVVIVMTERTPCVSSWRKLALLAKFGTVSRFEVIYEMFHILNCGLLNQVSYDHRSYERNLSNCA